MLWCKGSWDPAPSFLQERQFRVPSPPRDCTAGEINYKRDLIVHYSAELQGNEAELKLRLGRQRKHQITRGSSAPSPGWALSTQLHRDTLGSRAVRGVGCREGRAGDSRNKVPLFARATKCHREPGTSQSLEVTGTDPGWGAVCVQKGAASAANTRLLSHPLVSWLFVLSSVLPQSEELPS